MKRILNIDYGSGNPAGAPDFRPLNPWGRPMPKPDREPLPPLYQVFAHDRRLGRIIPVSPKMGKEFCEAICMTIARRVGSGDWKNWSNPHVVKLM